jgi:hypothetical protein
MIEEIITVRSRTSKCRGSGQPALAEAILATKMDFGPRQVQHDNSPAGRLHYCVNPASFRISGRVHCPIIGADILRTLQAVPIVLGRAGRDDRGRPVGDPGRIDRPFPVSPQLKIFLASTTNGCDRCRDRSRPVGFRHRANFGLGGVGEAGGPGRLHRRAFRSRTWWTELGRPCCGAAAYRRNTPRAAEIRLAGAIIGAQVSFLRDIGSFSKDRGG